MVKSLLYTFLLSFLTIGLNAQSHTPVDQGMRYIEQKASEWQLTAEDYQGALISDMYTDKKTGNTYIYFQQAIDGVPVANAITPIVIAKSGKVFNVSSRFISNAKNKVVKSQAKITAADAITAAATTLGVKPGTINSPRAIVNGVHKFGKLDFVHNDVKVKQEYAVVDDKLILVWDMSLDLKGTADYWNAKVNAADGMLVSKHNYTIYCQHDHGKYAKHSNCAATHVAKKKADHQLTVNAANAALAMGGTYNAFAFPTESPIHGERTVFTDQIFPGGSPMGWHDVDNTEGADYTITRGNNVHAFLDREGTDFSNGDEPDAGMELNFDYPYDLEAEADDNESASVVNLFTANNQIHDITYLLGFTENAGNFQQNTYGNGGNGGDPVIAQAFDGFEAAPQTLDNANFSTPADGGSGRMQMFLWQNSGGALSIDAPANITGFVNPIGTAVAQFGGTIPTGNQPAITGKVVIAKDDNAGGPTQVCNPIVNADEVAGNIALVDRGTCEFSLKAFYAEQAGATTVLICNIAGADGPGTNGESVINMAAGERADEVTITPIFVPKSVCDRIRLEINNGVEVTMTLQERDPIGPAYRDAAFDNGVIAHEYGHGISNRLIGGPGQAGCLTNAEQMGEGISDFFALLLTVEEGDTRNDSRGIGNYVDFLAPNAGGIRTYPYTVDLEINPRNYSEVPGFTDDTGAVLIYSVGEVWTIAMWEMYWNIVDEKGLDVTWQDEDAGNFIVGRLAIEGMKLVGCNPSLIDMRDAVLAADEILYNGEHELAIWTAFAKRGMGWEATGGSPNDITDGLPSYEILPQAIKTLKISKSANTLVEAGDQVEVTLTAVNHVPETKTGVFITDELPAGATYIDGSASTPATLDGSTLTFNIGDLNYEDEVTITYTLQVDGGINSNTLFYDDIDGTDISEYDLQLIEGFSIWNTTTLEANSGEKSLYVRESATEENDQTVQLNGVYVGGNRPVMRFYHRYDTELINDGGFVMISTDGGNTFQQVGDKFIRNGYNTNLEYGTFAIPNLRGYSGTTDGEWVDSYVDLSEYKNQSVSIQFRFGSNETIAASVDNPGWFVDDIEIFDLRAFSSVACIQSATGDDESCSAALEFIVNSNGVTATDDVEKFGHLTVGVAPNPASDFVTINVTSDKSEPLQVDLTSVEGRFISSQQIFNSTKAARTFDTSGLQAGVYFITVRAGNEVVTTEKIVIQN